MLWHIIGYSILVAVLLSGLVMTAFLYCALTDLIAKVKER
jgi:hypothetical protein